MKVRTNYTGTTYITPGKEYEVKPIPHSKKNGVIIDNNGFGLIINLKSGCSWLRGRVWEVIE